MKTKIKKVLIYIFGEKKCNKIKSVIKYLINIPIIIKHKNLIVNEQKVDKVEVYELKNKNVFCGYYDLNPVKKGKMLVHVTSKKANPSSDIAELGYFDLITKKYHVITNTKAWCWQQGSRLRWSSQEENVIFFNTVSDNKYCCIKYDIKKEKVLKRIDSALYDIDSNEQFGISVNFSRLQRLRPGYGYNCLNDNSIGQNAPQNDGLFFVNLKTNEKHLLISLYDLASITDPEMRFEHYINHVSISPENDKIMFFHLWNESKDFSWNNQLCIINVDGSGFEVIENTDLVSHYNWKNNSELLITGINRSTKKEFYRYYNLDGHKVDEINSSHLQLDGHPVHNNLLHCFYSDTYPNEKCMQSLFAYDVLNSKYEILLTIFSNPILTSEKRCDLHPKLVNSDGVVLVDSTFKKFKRSVILVKLKDTN